MVATFLILFSALLATVSAQQPHTTSSPSKPRSTNFSCGPKNGDMTCQGLTEDVPTCCSVYGWCGQSSDYCGTDQCQPGYGACDSNEPPNSPDTPCYDAEFITITPEASTRTITSLVITTSISTVSASTVTMAAQSVTVTTTLTPATVTLPGSSAQAAPTVTVAVTTTLSASVVTVAVTSTLTPSASPSTVTQSFTATVTTTSTLNGVTTITPASVTSTVTPAPVTSTVTPAPITSTITTTFTTNPALLALATTLTTTTTTTVTSTYTCPTNQAVGNPSFEPSSLSPWIQLSAGTVTSGRINGGSGLSSFAYKFTIDSANPNLPQRIVQPISLCPGSTYSMSFNSRQSTATGSISVIGSVQVGSGALVQMAGGQVTGGLTYAAAGSVASLSVPAGQVPVAAVVIMEATFSGSLGVKEAYIDEVYLTRS
ncbi:hypothetical protein HBH56_137550 [Parastagonospora nodorum]|uniref:Chitin-binding type-1 domain-containing protein n=1 Tax=Phaeosphaeria nodorum (strain SN15 / ATCC MYA-4574 / FGSC 10173) TaxID=321614 RepID=A0A7U2EQT9_PHANO|nr:hypothetical protein HBH56_137550 [Parastagonospora nodorum]QRC91344.1 hypothetical protein JI435_426760 [Parastagonospora nodorum SN15]KAH3982833.1 hypothetical protein HBH51_035440 [Parastagonospora nodorum]KAH4032929.1 hypothetical protein HBI13_003940 [Parastagonospora nodorum]KAH4110740.1 hypothetical protein HBH46_003490 [Parastagonospora nodorum]